MATAVLLVAVLPAGPADAKPRHTAHKPVKAQKSASRLPGQKLRTRAAHPNPDPFGRSHLDEYRTYELRGL